MCRCLACRFVRSLLRERLPFIQKTHLYGVGEGGREGGREWSEAPNERTDKQESQLLTTANANAHVGICLSCCRSSLRL